MITIGQEEMVRSGLRRGRPGKEIAKGVGVSVASVYGIRDMLGLVEKIGKGKQNEIQLQLEAGHTASAIAHRCSVPRAQVLALRRFLYIQPNVEIPFR